MSFPDGIFGEHTIRWFNGGLFEDNAVIELDKGDMGILFEVSHSYNWSHVAPAIFGTLFECSLDPLAVLWLGRTTPAKRICSCLSSPS